MALLTCEDCQHEVSDRAEACPSCGRPIAGKPDGTCERCGEGRLVTKSGLRGPLEIITAIVWFAAFIPVGFVIYFHLNGKPWCTACHKRPVGARSSVSLVLLILLGLYVGMWVFALVTGTAK